MTDQEIIEIWERCAPPPTTRRSQEHVRWSAAAAEAFVTSTPRPLRVIRDAYVREFPNGPPPGTPGERRQAMARWCAERSAAIRRLTKH
jgi:hypothetical protein